jgi:NAD(P)-dependent dehydrogenase (short-subunit alcohol dehydrogenase family)
MGILSAPFRALVLGSSGTIGAAFIDNLKSHSNCVHIEGLSRNTPVRIDFVNPESIEISARELKALGPFQLIINTIGVLHTDNFMPEKKLDDLNADQLTQMMQTNAIGPALVIRYFSKLLDPQHGVLVTLSAKVGSIQDNRLGGWYSYRSSKAALNMLIKTASIELKRTQPNSILIALHPGTVNSELSKPFGGQKIGRPARDAVNDMVKVIEGLTTEDSGTFLTYSGEKLPW